MARRLLARLLRPSTGFANSSPNLSAEVFQYQAEPFSYALSSSSCPQSSSHLIHSHQSLRPNSFPSSAESHGEFSISEEPSTTSCLQICHKSSTYSSPFSDINLYTHHHRAHKAVSPYHFQKHSMSTPTIKLKVDRPLDAHADTDKRLRPILKIKTLILRQQNHAIKVKYIDIKRKSIGLANTPVGTRAYLKKYPNIFELFVHPNGKQLYCRLAKDMVDMLEEEKRIYSETEDEIVLKLRKLLMMCKDRRLKAGKIDFVRKAFGFPEDFTRVARKYPQYFCVVGDDPSPTIELVLWDEKLAISELEKKAKEEAHKAGVGEIETRGQPLEFKVSHSPGMFLKRKNLELLERWQKLPYVSPYQDYNWVQVGTSLYQKRVVAVMHEFLSLTIEKRTLMQLIGRFRVEFGLPQSIGKLVNRFPGIFYLSLKGNNKTVFLREGYERCQFIEGHVRQKKDETRIIEDHPLLQWRMKLIEMVRDGARVRAALDKQANARQTQAEDACARDSELEEASDEDEASSAPSDLDLVDSECDDEDESEDEDVSDDEPDEEDNAKDIDEEQRNRILMATNIRKIQAKPKKEIW